MPLFDFIEDEDVREKAENTHKIEVDQLTVDLTDSAKKQVDDAVTGLKAKNGEILGEKKDLQTELKKFENIDLEETQIASDFYAKNKDAEFLKDGTVAELLQQKTSQLISDHEATTGELNGKLKTAEALGSKYQTLFEAKVIDDGIRAEGIAQGILPEALTDIILRGQSIFSLDTAGQIEARDSEGKLALTEDSKVLTTKNWVEGLKVKSPHYWPGSEGAGAMGGKGGKSEDITTRLAELADKGDMEGFRALRDKHKKK